MPRNLSKSKLLAFKQCPKRLWLEVHKPKMKEDGAATQASYAIGNQVGDIARDLYDPHKKGTLIEIAPGKFGDALAESKALLESDKPVFEAGFSAKGALVFADVMLPDEARPGSWRMIEVKSSTSVKDYHRLDAAIQAYVAKQTGVSLSAISLAHIDNQFVYEGDGQYRGLLRENDLTNETSNREQEVVQLIAAAQRTADEEEEPSLATGRQCREPYECGFLTYCQANEATAKAPATWLPSRHNKELAALVVNNSVEMAGVPDELLNEKQLLVKRCTISGEAFVDLDGAREALPEVDGAAYFMDFETVNPAIPIWQGARPYQIMPFQFSVHEQSYSGDLGHHEFLDISGEDPSRKFAESLLDACGSDGPVFVYNAGFEKGRVSELAERFPDLSGQLLAINARVFDLLTITRRYYYHPDQHGSWSIKKVLPTIAPHLNYANLDGVQDGSAAMVGYDEAISINTTDSRKNEIGKQLLEYCKLDTLALVEIWRYFTDQKL